MRFITAVHSRAILFVRILFAVALIGTIAYGVAEGAWYNGQRIVLHQLVAGAFLVIAGGAVIGWAVAAFLGASPISPISGEKKKPEQPEPSVASFSPVGERDVGGTGVPPSIVVSHWVTAPTNARARIELVNIDGRILLSPEDLEKLTRMFGRDRLRLVRLVLDRAAMRARREKVARSDHSFGVAR